MFLVVVLVYVLLFEVDLLMMVLVFVVYVELVVVVVNVDLVVVSVLECWFELFWWFGEDVFVVWVWGVRLSVFFGLFEWVS